jgi:hypothetical protein
MFDHSDSVIGLWPGEGTDDVADDELVYRLTCEAMFEDWVVEEQHFLPGGLEEIASGPFLAAVVSSVDPSKLNGHDAVRLMQAQARLVSHGEAGKLVAIAEVAFSSPGDADSPVERSPEALEYAGVEVAAGLTLTRRAADLELDRALTLKHGLGRVLQALADGVVDVARVRVFCNSLGHLPQDTVDEVLDGILDDAAGLTTGQLQARLARLVLEADPDGSKSSFEEGLADRKVTAYPNPDHTANLNVSNGDPVEIAVARRFVEKLARSLKTGDESRTLDQLRHDVAVDLLQGKCVHGVTVGGGGGVVVTVPGVVLAGLSDQPGDLGGYGPVFAEIARKTVMENVDGEWRFVVTDNGRPVATGTLARRPNAGQQRQVRAAYSKCVHPGCREDAWDCDLDHRRQRRHGGATCVHNLAPLCRFHHRSKDEGGWKLQRLDNGDHQWTSPLGHTYTKKRGPPD